MPTPVALERPGARRARQRGTHANIWLFLVPSGIVLAAVLLYPLGYAIYLSLFNYDIGVGSEQFIGLGNYTALLSEARFWDSLERTALIVTSAVTLEFCLGLVVAYRSINSPSECAHSAC